jgi:hypothetical protein
MTNPNTSTRRRVSPAEVEALRVRLAPLDTAERRARYLAGDFPRAATVKDLNKRYRWDLYWQGDGSQALARQGGDLLDAHVDTALRAVVPSLTEAQ